MTYELYHHGVKGMRWGVRRYQNKDGSLTPAGKKHQARQDYKIEKKKALNNFNRKLSSLEKSGRGNDIEAVNKAAKEYDSERIAAKDKYKNTKTDAFGMRDVKQARKDVKKAFKEGRRDNYEKASKEQGRILNEVGYTDRNKANAAFANARRVVKEAMLLDAGYSPEKAKRGAEWFASHNWNITFTDNYRMYDYVDDFY